MPVEPLNWEKLWDSIASIIRNQLPDVDKSFIEAYWEGMVRAVDDLELQCEQYNNAKSINDLPTFVKKSWLLQEINWDPTEAAHAHLKLPFTVAVDGDTDFDFGLFTLQSETFIYLNGFRQEFETGILELDNTGATSIIRFPAGLPAGSKIVAHTLRRKTKIVLTADGSTSVFLYGGESDKDTVIIKINNISVTDGVIIESSTVIFRGGLLEGDTIRLKRGAQQFVAVATEGQTRVANPLFTMSEETTEVSYNGVNLGQIIVENDRVIFIQPPREGDIIEVIATLIDQHDHQKDEFIYPTSASQMLTLSGEPRTSFGTELANSPIFVFLDDVLLETSDYTLAGALITLPAAPAGTRASIWYTTASPMGHIHNSGTITATAITDIFNFGFPMEQVIVSIDGAQVVEGVDYTIRGQLKEVIKLTADVPIGTDVSAIAQVTAFNFVSRTGFDTNIVAADAMQDGIDLPTISLLPPNGFSIIDGKIFSVSRVNRAWFKNALVDEKLIQNNFASFTPFTAENSSESFKILIQAFMSAAVLGPRIFTIENFGRIVMGLPFAPEAGVVKSVTTLGNVQTVTLTIGGADQVFDLPPGLAAAVIPGQEVAKFDALSQGLGVFDSKTNWIDKFPWLAFIGRQFSDTYDIGALYDRGVSTTEIAEMVYDVLPRRLVKTALALPDSIRTGDWVEYTDGVTIFKDIISDVVRVGGETQELLLLPISLAAPALGTAVTVTIHYRVPTIFDAGKAYDQPDPGLFDSVNQTLFDLLKHFTFLVEVDPLLLNKDAIANLIVFLDNVKAASTNFILISRLGIDELSDGQLGIAETVSVDVAEATTPADTGYVTAIAYMYADFNYTDVNFTAA